jgi:hypothetical protein
MGRARSSAHPPNAVSISQLTSQIDRFERPTYFRDVTVRGPFRFLRPDHFFRESTDAQNVMEIEDVLCFSGAAPLVSWILETRAPWEASAQNFCGGELPF